MREEEKLPLTDVYAFAFAYLNLLLFLKELPIKIMVKIAEEMEKEGVI